MATPARKPSISVIIPVRNGAEDLECCLASLQESTFHDYECIVADDASTDKSAEVPERFGARVIRLPSTRGPAAARNRAAREARADILFFVDSDVLVKPETLQLVYEWFCEDARVDAVIGSYDDDPSQPDLLSQYRNLLHHFTHQTAHEDAFTFWGGCGAIRREIFQGLGGFAEWYERASIEDIEFGYRLKAAGFRIRLDKRIQVKHRKRWTLWKVIRTDVFDRGVPWTELILRSGQMPADLNLKVSQRLSVVIVHLLVLSGVGLVARGALASALSLGLAAVLWLFSYWMWDAFSARQGGKLAGAVALAGVTAALLYSGGAAYQLILLAVGLGVTTVGHGWARKGSRGPAAATVSAAAALGVGAVSGTILWTASPPAALAGPAALLIAVAGLNLPLYRFLTRRLHLLFTITVLPFHLLFHYYSGVSFVLGTARYFVGTYVVKSLPKYETQSRIAEGTASDETADAAPQFESPTLAEPGAKLWDPETHRRS